MRCQHPQLFIQHLYTERVKPCMYCERNKFLDALRAVLVSLKAVAAHSVQPAMREDAKEQIQLIDALLAQYPDGIRAPPTQSEPDERV